MIHTASVASKGNVSSPTPSQNNPFGGITLVRFEKVSSDERRMVQCLTAAAFRRLGYNKPVEIEYSKVGNIHRTSGGCRFNRLNHMSDVALSTTFMAEGMHEITADIRTGQDTAYLMGRIRDLIVSGQTIPRKLLAKQIEAINNELKKLETSRVVPMNPKSEEKPAEEKKENPIFGMQPGLFAMYLNDLAGFAGESTEVTTTLIIEVGSFMHDDHNPPKDAATGQAIIAWLDKQGCLVKGSRGSHLHQEEMHALLNNYRQEGSFPLVEIELPTQQAQEVQSSAEVTPTTVESIAKPVRKPRGPYKPRAPKKIETLQLEAPAEKEKEPKKARKKYRLRLERVMANFDADVLEPLATTEQAYLEASRSGNSHRTAKLLRKLIRLERLLGPLRDYRAAFEQSLQRYLATR